MNPETRERLLIASTATVTTQLLKRGLRHCYLRGVRPLDASTGRLVGPAYTLRYVPYREDYDPYAALGRADNVSRRAVEDCPPGAVLVADAREVVDCAVSGDILCQRLAVRGVAGMVTDGGIRDAVASAATGLPLYCAGPAAPAGPTRHVPVDCEVPIACGGVAVYPGDIMVGDGDGVAVIPAALADEVAADAAEQEDIETFIASLVAGGRPVIGTYPPTDEIRAEYRAWVAAGRPDR